MTQGDPIVRLKTPTLVKFRRPIWCIIQPAWWRGGEGKWVPVENTLSYTRKQAWEKFEANYADPKYRKQSVREARAVTVQIDLYEPPPKGAKRKPWWVSP